MTPRTATDTDGASRPSAGPGNRSARIPSVERLLAAALDLFVANGYQATTVQQIATRANLTKGAVYFHFASKEEILAKLLEDAQAAWAEPIHRAVGGAGESARAQLVRFVHAQAIAAREHMEHVMLVILMSSEFRGTQGVIGQMLDHIWRTMQTLLCDIIDAGRQQGVFRDDLPTRELSAYILAVNQGCFFEWYQRGAALEGDMFVRTLRSTLLRGLEPVPPGEGRGHERDPHPRTAATSPAT